MKKDAPFNPHCNEPVESGKFCWRINDGRAWKKETHDTENEALNTAKTYCIDNIGVGEYTIHIGITKTEPVETQQLIDRYITHIEMFGDIGPLFSAMGLPSSMHAKAKKDVARATQHVLQNLTHLCKRTTILSYATHLFSVKNKDVGIVSTSLPYLLMELRAQYGHANPDWTTVRNLQILLVRKSRELISDHSLPFELKAMCLWQGYERTKNKLHIVCTESYGQKRFHRIKGSPLCVKTPKIENNQDEHPTPCLTCVERLIKLIA